MACITFCHIPLAKTPSCGYTQPHKTGKYSSAVYPERRRSKFGEQPMSLFKMAMLLVPLLLWLIGTALSKGEAKITVKACDLKSHNL